MTSIHRLKYGIVIFWILFIFNTIAGADVVADLRYWEIQIGSDSWQYDYVYTNASDPSTYAGFDLFKVKFELDPSVELTSYQLPTGWDLITGSGFIDTFSKVPGPLPIGADIPPGDSLAGFVFRFDDQVGNLPFVAFFTDPDNIGTPATDSGTSNPIPLPAPIWLLTGGLIAMGVIGKKKHKKQRPSG